MTTKEFNRVQIVFNAEHKPYLYGAVHIVDGDLKNQRWESPFVISKRRSDGEEVVYGTIKRTLEKISSQIERIRIFQLETQAKLEAEGIAPPTLPESEVADRILDEQEDLVEDVLLTVSVNVRILSEIFQQKLEKSKVNVYDYDGGGVGRIELSKIANLLVHNRYILVKDHYIVDLISNKEFMAEKPQMGLKIDFLEYISEVGRAVNGITVKDLISKLWGMTKRLSASSNIKDIVFLTQNLYTMGGFVVGSDTPIGSGLLKTILDRVATKYIERMYPQNSAPEDIQIEMIFSTPRFYLEPDLDQKQIRIQMQVNGNPETLVMDYDEFFSEVIKASGNRKLHPNSVG
ncbi:MAG: hypothetical protein F4Z85_18560 [Gemmatimonadetes bacterium]|nr:hypothetical protein [Gemmatimonadota bacterium]MYB68611.1 hypothetical protein [Gemmatimonadota bacterium]